MHPKYILRNLFLEQLKLDKVQMGMWLSMVSDNATEIITGAGFEFAVVDMEHGANEVQDVVRHLRAASSEQCSIVVRPAKNDKILIERILDTGAQTILVPMIDSEEDALAAVEATRYPPVGRRGFLGSTRAALYGRIIDYAEVYDHQIGVILQIETSSALQNLEKICSVEGVDGIFIGALDLSFSMGKRGQLEDADFRNLLWDTVRRIKAQGKPVGILAANQDFLRSALNAGATFFTVGNDQTLLARSSEELYRRCCTTLSDFEADSNVKRCS